MVSDASKKKAAQKKAAAAAKRGGKAPAASASSKAAAAENGSKADSLAKGIGDIKISDRTCTGVLCSLPLSRDIRIESLSLTFHGHELIVDSELELNYGRRYGLLGLNGCGKSTLLTAIGLRELPIPEHMDIYHLSREIEASDMISLEAVINCDEERLQLEKEAEMLAAQMMVVANNLNSFMNVWMLWMHRLLRSELLRSYLVLALPRKCKKRRHEIFLVAGG